MQEDFLHYLFEFNLIQNTEFEIMSSGQKNFDAGPDFFNAKIKIDNTIWVGNVEIHILASDWNRHKHQKNKAYDNIILHLVYKNDIEIQASNGSEVLTYELKFDPKLYQRYQDLLKNLTWIHCEKQIEKIDSFTKNLYVEALSIERLERKSRFFRELFLFNDNNWELSFYQALVKGFGSKLNSVPFELLAKSIDLKVILRHRNSVFQLEALLFGQAGFFEDEIENDEYFRGLKNEYLFLKEKYNLQPVRHELFKFSKVRPYNFPSVKIALLAQLLSQYQSILSKVLECKKVEDVKNIFQLEVGPYWENHYRFGNVSKPLKKRLAQSSWQYLIINIIIPFLYFYAQNKNVESLREKVIDWLVDLEPEKNNITEKWEKLGIDNSTALQSQGLIELKNEKCNNHACIDCRIGHKILTLSWYE